MSETAKPCPKCSEPPLLTKEEDFLGDETTWSILHICKKGFTVTEGPCISRQDAIDAWNLRVKESK